LDMNDPTIVNSLLRNILIQESGHKLPYTETQYADAVRRSIEFRARGFRDAADLIVPVSGTYSSAYGQRVSPKKGASVDHHGIDIAAPTGTPVYAAADGIVQSASSVQGYGNLIQLDSDGLITRYGHLSTFAVKPGDRVSQGQKIGEVGNTGVSTGPHLHFEVQPKSASAPVDPAAYLPDLPSGPARRQTISGSARLPVTPEFITSNGRLLRLEK